MVYVRYLLTSIREHGEWKVILATSVDSSIDPYVVELSLEFGSILDLQPIEFPTPSKSFLQFIHHRLAKQESSYKVLISLIRELLSYRSVDYVLIPFLDDYTLFPMSVKTWPFDNLPWSGISIRPRFHLKKMGAIVPSRIEDIIEKFSYRRILRNRGLDCLFTIDPYLQRFFGSDKIKHVPDPADISSVTPSRLPVDVPSDAVVLLVYGYLDLRKALDRLINAFLDPRVGSRIVLLLAGVQNKELNNQLCSRNACILRREKRLIEINRHITDAEEAALFKRADIVWCYFPMNYCSSGALVRAGQTSRPVIATREGLVGLIVRELKMGIPVSEFDDEELVLALIKLECDAALRRSLGTAGYDFFSNFTIRAFGNPIIRRIAKYFDVDSLG